MTHTRRVEPNLTGEFAKDAAEERFLSELNNYLVPFERGHLPSGSGGFPNVYVYGAPRSGTTLLTQVLVHSLDIGYVDHLIAAFWKAPVTGIRLSRKLFRGTMESSFESDYGRTGGVREPHEFGYFWSDLFQYDEPLRKTETEENSLDWERIAALLSAMTRASGRPMLYKSYFAGWHISRLLRVRPDDIFVCVIRDPVENALSILDMRREYSGNLEEWPGLRPSEYHWLQEEPPAVQAAGQVHFLEKSYRREAAKVEGIGVMEVRYEELCERPMGLVEKIRSALEERGVDVRLRREPPRSFRISRRGDVARGRDAISEALARWEGGITR